MGLTELYYKAPSNQIFYSSQAIQNLGVSGEFLQQDAFIRTLTSTKKMYVSFRESKFE